MELLDVIKLIVGFIVIPYLVYNHQRVDKVIKEQAVTNSKVNDIKEDIKEIKDGVNKLVERELNKKR
jgi:hypothetical protein